jgi:hypothetical protein
MSTGISLCIGLNSVNPEHYSGWSGPLLACEADAYDMHAIANSKGFSSSTLLTQSATRKAVIASINDAAARLQSGDIFMISYSGHGGQLPDLNNDEEADATDETWCLFDGELVDDELYVMWAGFRPGVRILMFSDSCHSGTISRDLYYARNPSSIAPDGYRAMPREVAMSVYQNHRDMYDTILTSISKEEARGKVQASVVLISGCQDHQLSADGSFNGRFTGMLKSVWNGGKFKGDYRQFHAAITKNMPPDQTPHISQVGVMDAAFIKQSPFQI